MFICLVQPIIIWYRIKCPISTRVTKQFVASNVLVVAENNFYTHINHNILPIMSYEHRSVYPFIL